MTEVWNADRLREKIDGLREKGRTSDEQFMQYVLNPYVASLGYDVFNMDEVDSDIASGRLRVHVTEDVDLIVSLSNYLPTASNEDDKIFLCVDMRDKELSLYLNALGSWEQVGAHNLQQEDRDGNYPQMMRMVTKESLKRTLHEKGGRLFTEGVLRQQLDDGRYDNRFVRDVLLEMIQSPNESVIRLVAEGLADKYSTEPVQKLIGGLSEFKKVGLEKILGELLKESGTYTPQEKLEPAKDEKSGGKSVVQEKQPESAPQPELVNEPMKKKEKKEESAQELQYVAPAYSEDQLFEGDEEEGGDESSVLELTDTAPFFGTDWGAEQRVNPAPIKRAKTDAGGKSSGTPDLMGIINGNKE